MGIDKEPKVNRFTNKPPIPGFLPTDDTPDKQPTFQQRLRQTWSNQGRRIPQQSVLEQQLKVTIGLVRDTISFEQAAEVVLPPQRPHRRSA